MSVLVTGGAGFIGFHLCKSLLVDGFTVICIDNLNPYYDPSLKRSRVDILHSIAHSSSNASFHFIQASIEDAISLANVFNSFKPNIVVNLAAQAGVRHSIDNPSIYIQSNIVGFLNILECCRHSGVDHLLYASSSSVYGGNTQLPFSESHSVDHPISLYAATKKSNELMAHSYSHLYGLPSTGLRFFTVYGPWGRPDMALFLFTQAILDGEPIKVFNHGNMMRDFTFVDDIISSIRLLFDKKASPSSSYISDEPDPSISSAPYRIFNIGNSQPISLMEYITALEDSLGLKACKHYLPLQPGDVPSTSADTSKLKKWIGFKPSTSITDGISRFVSWYLEYYGSSSVHT